MRKKQWANCGKTGGIKDDLVDFFDRENHNQGHNNDKDFELSTDFKKKGVFPGITDRGREGVREGERSL
jgi:hypothetical protein